MTKPVEPSSTARVVFRIRGRWKLMFKSLIFRIVAPLVNTTLYFLQVANKQAAFKLNQYKFWKKRGDALTRHGFKSSCVVCYWVNCA